MDAGTIVIFGILIVALFTLGILGVIYGGRN